jgi:hypothetical protein
MREYGDPWFRPDFYKYFEDEEVNYKANSLEEELHLFLVRHIYGALDTPE